MKSRFFKLSALLFLTMILTQCTEKTSAEYVQEGLESMRSEQIDKAGEAFLKAVEKDPNSVEGHYGLGGVYNFQKKLTEAEQEFKTVLKIDPIHINAIYSLGYTYELMGNKEKAEESYIKYRRLKGKMDSLMDPEKN